MAHAMTSNMSPDSRKTSSQQLAIDITKAPRIAKCVGLFRFATAACGFAYVIRNRYQSHGNRGTIHAQIDEPRLAMTRAAILDRLRAERENLRAQFGVDSLALFGSVARDEAGPESDVDLLVEFNRPITLFDLVAVQQYLERSLGVNRVDLIPRDSIYPAFRSEIEREAQHVG